MIKLMDILENTDITNDEHWRDHIKAIIKHATIALKSNDPEIVADHTTKIIEHAEKAREKHEMGYDKVKPSTIINSSSYNTYNGDDSDFTGYGYAGLGGEM